MNEKTEFKQTITVKNVLRVVAILCVIFFICPTFMVSCSNAKVDVSAAKAMVGVKYQGDPVSDAQPLLIFTLLLPLSVAVALFINKWNDFQVSVGSAVAGFVDFIIWIVFKSQVKNAAAENGCKFRTTWFYALNMLCLVIIILLSVLVAVKTLNMETDLVKLATGQEAKKALNDVTVAVNKMSNSVSQMAATVAQNAQNASNNRQAAVNTADIIGYCQQCGKPITKDSRFCISCGKPVPEDLLASAGVNAAAEQPIEKVEGEIVDNNPTQL